MTHRVRRICQYRKVWSRLREGVTSMPASRKPVKISAPALLSWAVRCGTWTQLRLTWTQLREFLT